MRQLVTDDYVEREGAAACIGNDHLRIGDGAAAVDGDGVAGDRFDLHANAAAVAVAAAEVHIPPPHEQEHADSSSSPPP